MLVEVPLMVRRWLEDPDYGLLAVLDDLPYEDTHRPPKFPGRIVDPTEIDPDMWEESGGNAPEVMVRIDGGITIAGVLSTALRDGITVPTAIAYKTVDPDQHEAYRIGSYVMRAALHSLRTLLLPANEAARMLNSVQLITMTGAAMGARPAAEGAEEGLRLFDLAVSCYVRDTL